MPAQTQATQASILAALKSAPLSISQICDAIPSASRAQILAALRALRAEGAVEMLGNKRGATYGLTK